jgi:hypothetical protein
MSVPFVYDGSIAYKGKYLDGFTPYIFDDLASDNFFINLHSFDKIWGMFNIHNNKNGSSRILNGIENAHNFFINKQGNSICSNINHWSYIDHIKFGIRQWFYFIFVYILSVLYLIKGSINHPNTESKLVKILQKLYVICIREFCV